MIKNTKKQKSKNNKAVDWEKIWLAEYQKKNLLEQRREPTQPTYALLSSVKKKIKMWDRTN